MADISKYMGKMSKECREHNEKMLHIRAEWKQEEWTEMEQKLQALSLDELRRVSTLAGMQFEGGVESLKDRKVASVKEQIILVLDEVGKENLLRAYDVVIQEREEK